MGGEWVDREVGWMGWVSRVGEWGGGEVVGVSGCE